MALGHQVFVAVEFINGPTLNQWLEQKRPWREVLVMLQAGQGSRRHPHAIAEGQRARERFKQASAPKRAAEVEVWLQAPQAALSGTPRARAHQPLDEWASVDILWAPK